MIAFTVEGVPATKGSWRPITVNGRTRLIPQLKRSKPWQEMIAWKARVAMAGRLPFAGPVRVTAVFRLARPKSTKLATPRPDGDKLDRCLWDAMTGIVYGDDSQVTEWSGRKEWGAPGVDVRVEEVAP